MSIFISAGEASGDLYGSLLIEAVSRQMKGVSFFGLGGEKMRHAGLETIVDAREIAMVGIVEVVPGLPRVWKAFQRLLQTIERRKPAIAILIDFPDFNLRLAKKLKRAGVQVVYFVAPQVWAWRKGRLSTIRENVDRLLCIFPFEEEFFQKSGVRAQFVGHPLIGRVAPSMSEAEFRRKLGIETNAPLITLLPGSRRKEIALNLPPMLDTAAQIAKDGVYEFVIAAAGPEIAAAMRDQVRTRPERFHVVEYLTYDAVGHASVAIVASGTATVETALLGTPMVVVYRVTGASWLLGRWLVDVPFLSMVNLVAEREVVPELIQDQFQPEKVAAEVLKLLHDPVARSKMVAGLKDVVKRLRTGQNQGANPDAVGDPIARSVAVIEQILQASRK